jgi:hypothetical protein
VQVRAEHVFLFGHYFELNSLSVRETITIRALTGKDRIRYRLVTKFLETRIGHDRHRVRRRTVSTRWHALQRLGNISLIREQELTDNSFVFLLMIRSEGRGFGSR